MSSIAIRGVRAQSEATLDLARKLVVSCDNCLLQALETYETQIECLWKDLESTVEVERARKVSEIEASRQRQQKLRVEIQKLERIVSVVKRDQVTDRIDELLLQGDEEDNDVEEDTRQTGIDCSVSRSRSLAIEELKATIRRQLSELNSVLSE